AYTMDAVIKIAFGVKLDSFNDSHNPIITNARKVFQMDPGILDMFKFLIIVSAQWLAKLLKIEILKSQSEFFTTMVIDIMEQKRAEFAKAKSFAKSGSFIEFMLEAEDEGRKLEAGFDGVDSKKTVKCKC